MPAIFAVCEAVREWLADNNVKGLDDASMYAQMMRKAKDAERKEVSFRDGIIDAAFCTPQGTEREGIDILDEIELIVVEVPAVQVYRASQHICCCATRSILVIYLEYNLLNSMRGQDPFVGIVMPLFAPTRCE